MLEYAGHRAHPQGEHVRVAVDDAGARGEQSRKALHVGLNMLDVPSRQQAQVVDSVQLRILRAARSRDTQLRTDCARHITGMLAMLPVNRTFCITSNCARCASLFATISLPQRAWGMPRAST